MVEQAMVLIGVGIFIGVLGVLIKFVGVTELIAGYDPDRVTDEEGLADFIGMNTLYVAFLTVCVGVLELETVTIAGGWYWIVYLVAVFGFALRMIRGARRYETSTEHTTD